MGRDYGLEVTLPSYASVLLRIGCANSVSHETSEMQRSVELILFHFVERQMIGSYLGR